MTVWLSFDVWYKMSRLAIYGLVSHLISDSYLMLISTFIHLELGWRSVAIPKRNIYGNNVCLHLWWERVWQIVAHAPNTINVDDIVEHGAHIGEDFVSIVISIVVHLFSIENIYPYENIHFASVVRILVVFLDLVSLCITSWVMGWSWW